MNIHIPETYDTSADQGDPALLGFEMEEKRKKPNVTYEDAAQRWERERLMLLDGDGVDDAGFEEVDYEGEVEVVEPPVAKGRPRPRPGLRREVTARARSKGCVQPMCMDVMASSASAGAFAVARERPERDRGRPDDTAR